MPQLLLRRLGPRLRQRQGAQPGIPAAHRTCSESQQSVGKVDVPGRMQARTRGKHTWQSAAVARRTARWPSSCSCDRAALSICAAAAADASERAAWNANEPLSDPATPFCRLAVLEHSEHGRAHSRVRASLSAHSRIAGLCHAPAAALPGGPRALPARCSRPRSGSGQHPCMPWLCRSAEHGSLSQGHTSM